MMSDLECLARDLYTANKGSCWKEESWNIRDYWMSIAREQFDPNGLRLPPKGKQVSPNSRHALPTDRKWFAGAQARPRKPRLDAVNVAKLTTAEQRTRQTDVMARRILKREIEERDEKTARLKRARIAATIQKSNNDEEI